MSNFDVEAFKLPDFSSAEAEGQLFPRPDQDPDQAGAPVSAAFDQEFASEKSGDAPPDFEAQFTTNDDINALMEDAKIKVAEMVEGARQEVDRIEQEAYNKGYEDGKKLGHQESVDQGVEKLVPCIEAFEKGVKEIAEARTVTYKNCEAELIELFNALSRRVIHKELGRSNEFLIDVVKEAMKEITQQEKIAIRLNPDDLRYAEEFKNRLAAEMGNIKSVSLEKDESITRGGCVIDTNFGRIDSRVETKIEEIEKSILEEKPKKEIYKTGKPEPEPDKAPTPEEDEAPTPED